MHHQGKSLVQVVALRLALIRMSFFGLTYNTFLDDYICMLKDKTIKYDRVDSYVIRS